MIRAAGLATLIELLVVVFLRRKHAGGTVSQPAADLGRTADGRESA